MPELRLNLLGYPKIFVNGQPVSVERRKTLALAAYLAMESGSVYLESSRRRTLQPGCSRETLAAMFWPESSQQQAAAYLRQALWDLARSIGEEWIGRDGQSIRLNPGGEIRVDAAEFVLRLEAWKAGNDQTDMAVAGLTETVALYRGDFLEGFSLRDCQGFDDWQRSQADMLRLHLAQALESLVELCTRQQAWDIAIQYARRWSELDLLNEAAHRALMLVYHQMGQRNTALRQFQRCKELLAAELGIQPAAETTALHQQIQQSVGIGSPVELRIAQAVPTGTVTFLFTDIEGSTRLWETYPSAMQKAFERQEAIIRQTMQAHGGYVYKMIGDAFQVAFSTATDALHAAIEAQLKLHAEAWGPVGQVKVRMALHTGVTEERGDDYVGPELNRVARIMNAGYGGQVLLSRATTELVRGHLPAGVSLKDYGEHHLKDLEHPEHIYQALVASLPDQYPPLKTIDFLSANLPVMATPFVGRRQELEQIEALLASPDCRLITLLGIGGSGKTRLALQAASQSLSYQHNACFISLANSQSLDEMLLAFARGINFAFVAPPALPLSLEAAKAQLFQYLAGKRALLVLDNFEQLVSYAELLGELLQAAPRIKMIVTSRERLNLSGEWVLDVLGLRFPSQAHLAQVVEYPAVQLFIASAQRVCGARLTEADHPAIVRICQLLEGVPLGIEMSASWVKMLTCDEIAAEIEKNIDFLSSSWRGMPERHRTLRAVFDHSWKLLVERERKGFIRLAVFKGGFSRQAALEVAGVSILQLASLTDKSFLRRVADGRYEIHPVLSVYVREKLRADSGLLEEVEKLHAQYYSHWFLEMVEDLRGQKQLAALAALRINTLDLQAAILRLVLDHELVLLERVLPGLVLFSAINDQPVFVRNLEQIMLQLREFLNAEQEHPALLALNLAILRFITSFPKKLEVSDEYEKQSMDLIEQLPDTPLKAYSILLNCIGPAKKPLQQTLDHAQLSFRIFKEQGNAWEIALVQLILGDMLNFGHGDLKQSRGYYQASLQTFSELGNLWGMSLVYNGMVLLDEQEGNWEEAYQLGCRANDLMRQLNSQNRSLEVKQHLAENAIRLGKIEEARGFFSEILAYLTHNGDQERAHYYQKRLGALAGYSGSDKPVSPD